MAQFTFDGAENVRIIVGPWCSWVGGACSSRSDPVHADRMKLCISRSAARDRRDRPGPVAVAATGGTTIRLCGPVAKITVVVENERVGHDRAMAGICRNRIMRCSVLWNGARIRMGLSSHDIHRRGITNEACVKFDRYTGGGRVRSGVIVVRSDRRTKR